MHLNEEEEALSEDEISYINSLKEAAISYVKGQTGIKEIDTEDDNGRKLDDYEDLTTVVLVLVADMYDNRQYSVDKSSVNKVAESILGLYRFNLVPGESK